MHRQARIARYSDSRIQPASAVSALVEVTLVQYVIHNTNSNVMVRRKPGTGYDEERGLAAAGAAHGNHRLDTAARSTAAASAATSTSASTSCSTTAAGIVEIDFNQIRLENGVSIVEKVEPVVGSAPYFPGGVLEQGDDVDAERRIDAREHGRPGWAGVVRGTRRPFIDWQGIRIEACQTACRRNPVGSIARLQEILHGVGRESVVGRERLEPGAVEDREAVLRTEPEKPAGVRNDAAHEVMSEPIG